MSLGLLRGMYKALQDSAQNGTEFDFAIPPPDGERLPVPVSPDEVDDLIWMLNAKALMGTKEVPGKGNNEDILQWAQDIGGDVAREYTADSIPWCGLFTGYVSLISGLMPVDKPLWALNWNKWEARVDPAYGTLLVFRRSGGGHVGYYISEDDTTFHVLGGNQSDQVNIARVSKSQLVSARWPTEHLGLYEPKRIRKVFDGKPLSSGQMA